MATARSMFDQMLFPLPCMHVVVLGRLERCQSWTCEECGRVYNLSASPLREHLVKELNTANDIDLQKKEKGAIIERETVGGR